MPGEPPKGGPPELCPPELCPPALYPLLSRPGGPAHHLSYERRICNMQQKAEKGREYHRCTIGRGDGGQKKYKSENEQTYNQFLLFDAPVQTIYIHVYIKVCVCVYAGVVIYMCYISYIRGHPHTYHLPLFSHSLVNCTDTARRKSHTKQTQRTYSESLS